MGAQRNAIIIVGATGDLAHRKLIPALALLYARGLIDCRTRIIGSGRGPLSDADFRDRFNVPDPFRECLHYHQGINGLRYFLQQQAIDGRVVVFLALPPDVYGSTARQLYDEGLREEVSLVIEKPFGYDFESARALNTELARYYPEKQIFRLDHYLAKEAVQNILVFRFANSLFYPVWNSRYVESIQINAFEDIGIEKRGRYFDHAGIIRDMVQNHLLQLLCLLAMEAPVSLDAEDIRLQKLSVLKAISVVGCERFQYAGYRSEEGVDPHSTTETYAEMELRIDTFRWTGMPVYIRTGKALDRKGTEIGLRFKTLPRLLYNRENTIPPNQIVFKIQPAEGIVVDIVSKVPGGGIELTNTNMTFCYRDAFGSEIPEAYQKLLLDALSGDRTLFVSAEETELAWQALAPALDTGTVRFYERGQVPSPCRGETWIDFAKYAAMCG